MKTILFFILSLITLSYDQIDSSKNLNNKVDFNNQQDTSANSKVNSSNQNSLSLSKINENEESYPKDNIWLIISGLFGIFGSSITWLYNEWRKRISKLVIEKEERYKKLISLIRSFGSGSEDVQKANEFIIELQLCWMYCPDIVIKKGNDFLESMTNKKEPKGQNEKDLAKGEFILEIRKDLIQTSNAFNFFKRRNTTKLEAIDFKDVYYKSKKAHPIK